MKSASFSPGSFVSPHAFSILPPYSPCSIHQWMKLLLGYTIHLPPTHLLSDFPIVVLLNQFPRLDMLTKPLLIFYSSSFCRSILLCNSILFIFGSILYSQLPFNYSHLHYWAKSVSTGFWMAIRVLSWFFLIPGYPTNIMQLAIFSKLIFSHRLNFAIRVY